MEKKIIKIGAFPNDKTGDKLRDAFIKVNSNFGDLYTLSGLTSDISGLTSDISGLTTALWSVIDSIADKVDKVDGKGLSTEDYTTEEKNKLAGVEADANNYEHPATHPLSMITETDELKVMTAAERTKLGGLSEHDKGFFANEAAIVAAIPEGQAGWFVRNGETDTVWVWDVEGSDWVDTGSAGASSNATIVEWVQGDEMPTIVCDQQVGLFSQGRKHLVSYSVIAGQTIATVTVVNYKVTKLEKLKTGLDTQLDIKPFGNTEDGYYYIVAGAGATFDFAFYLDDTSLDGAGDLVFETPRLAVERIVAFDADNIYLLNTNRTPSVKKFSYNNWEFDESFSPSIPGGAQINFVKLDSVGNLIIQTTLGTTLYMYDSGTNAFEALTYARPGGCKGIVYASDYAVRFGSLLDKINIATGVDYGGFTNPFSLGSLYINDLFIDDNGKMLVAMSDNSQGSAIIRLDTDGSIDSAFSASSAFSSALAIRKDALGYVFAVVVNAGVTSIVKLSSTGVLDSTYNIVVSGNIFLNSFDTNPLGYVSFVDGNNGDAFVYNDQGVLFTNEKDYLTSILERLQALEA